MSREQMNKVLQALPNTERGVYWKTLDQHANGQVKINKSGLITVPVALWHDQLGAQVDDLRAVLAPHCFDNKLVPMLVFIDPAKFLETQASLHSDTAQQNDQSKGGETA